MGGVIAVDAAQVAAVGELDHGFDRDPLPRALLKETQPELLRIDPVNHWWASFRRNSITRASLTKARRAVGRVVMSSSPNCRANARASLFQKGKKSCWKNSPWSLINRSERRRFPVPCSRKKTCPRGPGS